MRVIQSVNGTFHHFDLARELEHRGCLKRIYSTFPWTRLKREGVPREHVRTFPYLHTSLMLYERRWPMPKKWSQGLHRSNFLLFDNWVASRVEECDAFVGLSGSGLKTGGVVQSRGGKYVCDRGSSHIRYQNTIVNEEYARWGFPVVSCDPAMIDREEQEYAQADGITVPSEFVRRSFIEMGIPAEKLHKVPYGVRLERFKKSADPSPDSFDILFAGRVSIRKGIPYLLEAFQKFQHPKKRLRMIGTVEDQARQYLSGQDTNGIEVLGHMPQPKLAEWMSRSHVMVLPSIEEGLALVQGQAMACGCPLISSLHSGGEDLIQDGVEGFLIPVRSSQAILDGLTRLADEPGLRERMSEAAINRAQKIGGWSEYGSMYASVLLKLTGEADTAAQPITQQGSAIA